MRALTVLLAAIVASTIAAAAPAVSGTDRITTVVGTGVYGYAGDGGPALQAKLGFLGDVDLVGSSTLVIADASNHRIRVAAFPRGGPLAGPRTIRTVAGNGASGSSGDGGAATAAALRWPMDIALDAAGNIYIADWENQRVRRVDAAGVMTTVAGTGTRGFSGDGGPATAAQLSGPHGVALGVDGRLYIADKDNHRIRMVSPAGVITTVAGTGTFGFSGDGGPATSAQLAQPSGIAFDDAGNLLFADTANHRVRRVSPAGAITTVAGTGTLGFAGDGGPATSAQLTSPRALALDGAGNLYIGDGYRVRKVTPTGTITTVAGTGASGYAGDGGPAAAAQLGRVYGLAVDASGNLYVASSDHPRVQMVANVPPLAAFATAGSAAAGSEVAFDASASSDPNGAIVSYAWDFGDGQTGTGRTAAHTYASAGSFVVRLTVMDDSGARRATQRTLTIGPPGQPAPPADETPPPAPRVLCDGRIATIVGTPRADRLIGTPRRDVIASLGGADVVEGRGGNDLICGGAGGDTLRGGPGNDRLLGGAGADRLAGGPGRDQLYGGPGRDRGDGGPGRDRCLAERKPRCP